MRTSHRLESRQGVHDAAMPAGTRLNPRDQLRSRQGDARADLSAPDAIELPVEAAELPGCDGGGSLRFETFKGRLC